MLLSVREHASAMGNDHHTYPRPAVFANIYAAGSMTTNCLNAETVRLKSPSPKAWNTDIITMEAPASIK